MDDHLYSLLSDYAERFEYLMMDGETSKHIMTDSLPVAWFGDSEEYFKSDKRIVTVGINPSNKEFEYGANRFQIYDSEEIVPEVLEAEYNDYFYVNPYRKWFDCYEELLNLLDASYYGGRYKNRAIHLDALSSIATVEKWRSFERLPIAQNFLQKELAKQLIEYFDPDIILYSVAELNHTDFFDSARQIGAAVVSSVDSKKRMVKYEWNGRTLCYGVNNVYGPFCKGVSDRVSMFKRLFALNKTHNKSQLADAILLRLTKSLQDGKNDLYTAARGVWYVNNPEQIKYAVACDGSYNILGIFDIDRWEWARKIRDDIRYTNNKKQFVGALNEELTAQLKGKNIRMLWIAKNGGNISSPVAYASINEL